MRNFKSTKKRIDKKAINVFLSALVVFGNMVISGKGSQVMAQETMEYEEYENQASGQEILNVSAGFGLPELFNIGLRRQFEQFQIELSTGFVPDAVTPDQGLSIYTVSVNVRNHIAGSSELSDRRPWYLKKGLILFRYADKDPRDVEDHFFLDVRIGRDFNLSNKLGIYFDIGPVLNFASRGGEFVEEEFPPLMLGFGIGLFYRYLR